MDITQHKIKNLRTFCYLRVKDVGSCYSLPKVHLKTLEIRSTSWSTNRGFQIRVQLIKINLMLGNKFDIYFLRTEVVRFHPKVDKDIRRKCSLLSSIGEISPYCSLAKPNHHLVFLLIFVFLLCFLPFSFLFLINLSFSTSILQFSQNPNITWLLTVMV